MFVSDHDRIQPVDILLDSRQPRQRLSFPQPGIDEDAGAVAFQQRQIPRTSGSQYGNA
jgi:hypothetical protein